MNSQNDLNCSLISLEESINHGLPQEEEIVYNEGYYEKNYYHEEENHEKDDFNALNYNNEEFTQSNDLDWTYQIHENNNNIQYNKSKFNNQINQSELITELNQCQNKEVINNQDNKMKQSSILPPSKMEYTIVLDLDNTLIHTSENENMSQRMIYMRPYLLDFLRSVSKIAEIIIFTAGVRKYAEFIVNNIDPHREYISHIVSREHLTLVQKNNTISFYKDLSILGRNLNKTLFIDDMPSNFQLQPYNGISISPWRFDNARACQDQELLQMQMFITSFISQNMDVKKVIQLMQQDN